MSTLLDVSQQTFPTEVLGSTRPVLVDFWAPWCGPCKMLSPVIEKISTQLSDKVNFVKVNTDENPSIAGQYQISGIPCLVLFKEGKAVDRIIGFVPEQHIKAMLEKHLAS